MGYFNRSMGRSLPAISPPLKIFAYWQNSCGRIKTALELTLTADNLEFTFTSITERSPYFGKMSFYRYA